MASEAARGQTALQNNNYPLAIEHYTKALRETQSPLWLIQRSIAYQRTSQYALALADAENGVLAAKQRAKRELIATAQFRRAIALCGMGRFGDARMALIWSQKSNPKEPGLTLWIAKVKKDYDTAGGDEAECNKVTVKEVPDKVEEKKAVDQEKEKNMKLTAVPVAPKPTEMGKIRHDWYQSTTSVTIDIMANGVEKDKLQVLFEERSLEVSFPVVGSDSTFDMTLSPLYKEIDPTRCSFRVTPRKIEITLQKSMPSHKWLALESPSAVPTAKSEDKNPIVVPTATSTVAKNEDDPVSSRSLPYTHSQTEEAPDTGNPAAPIEKPPAYPTSSRTGPKNWDKIVGNEDEEDEGVDGFFKKLYKGADPDTRRAMMKSYQESGGTSLSTVWDDVGSRTFEPVPPKGMVAKKWDS